MTDDDLKAIYDGGYEEGYKQAILDFKVHVLTSAGLDSWANQAVQREVEKFLEGEG